MGLDGFSIVETNQHHTETMCLKQRVEFGLASFLIRNGPLALQEAPDLSIQSSPNF
jgi:hypothetical protein